jgi:hypothetical protein
MRATYSPEDNKIRIYPDAERLDAETYARVKAAGYIWAPKQKIFVAPMWTPSRADLAEELAGELGDEDTTLAERTEERAERFDEYGARRADEAHAAHEAVQGICDGIPLGQPILVGHHSERHARKQAERIQNGMRAAVKLWDTAEYWKRRAAGALRAAKYKELPAVRARRIKGLEADKRKQERTAAESAKFLELWNAPGLTWERARNIANYDHISRCYPLADYPRQPPASQYEGLMGLWSALDGIINAEQAAVIAIPAHERIIAHGARWIAHYNNRIAYEYAMLEEQGETALLAKPERAKLPPICNYQVPGGLDLPNQYRRGEMEHYAQRAMTQAEYAAIAADMKGTRLVGGSHRVRVALIRRPGEAYYAVDRVCVFLTDSKTHEPPAAVDPTPAPAPDPAAMAQRIEARNTERDAQTEAAAPFEALRQAAAAGVSVTVAPQLFPTPAPLAARMVELADIQRGHTVLEPSAGTGRLLQAVRNACPGAVTTAVEINYGLAHRLRLNWDDVRQADFMEWTGGAFDRIIMNPPFTMGADIKHIQRAACMLKPGSFAEAGTGVNVVLLTIEG